LVSSEDADINDRLILKQILTKFIAQFELDFVGRFCVHSNLRVP